MFILSVLYSSEAVKSYITAILKLKLKHFGIMYWLLQEFFVIITWTTKRLNILWVVWKATKQVCQDENLRKIFKDPERSSWGPFGILQRIFIMIFEKSLWIFKIIVKIFKDPWFSGQDLQGSFIFKDP